MNKQSLSQIQRQGLSSQQIIQVKLLELPLNALYERIQQEVITNPALEIATPNTDPNEQAIPHENELETRLEDDYLTHDDIPDYKLRIIHENEQNNLGDLAFPNDSKTLQQTLREQLNILELTPKQQLIAEQIVGNLSDDGYLRVKSREVEDYLLFNEQVTTTPEEFQQVLSIIQSLDPPGVAAHNLREALLIQLNKLSPSPQQRDAFAIIDLHFEDLANRRYEKIIAALGLTKQRFADAQTLITKLNPKPGNGFGSEFNAIAQRIIPDFIVRKNNDGIEVMLNDEGFIPKLNVNPGYVKLSEERIRNNKEQIEQQRYAKQLVYKARWFIEAVENRRNTLLRCMEVIVSLQDDFFSSGDVNDLKPMKLLDVAERTGNDVSTISRISNEKYVQCDYGIFPIKFFFSEGSEQHNGKVVSTRSIKALLENIVANEDKQNPYTDEQLASIMKSKGQKIARRTLAKYREQLGILPARLRRKLE